MVTQVIAQIPDDVVQYEAALLLAPVSNYSDGEDRGYRPALRWTLVHLPNTVARSGVFNIKGLPSEESAAAAVTASRAAALTPPDCIGEWLTDALLEEYEREV